MLHVHHLSIEHLQTLHPLIQDLSFTVNPGDKLAIIGEEGNGKSTLLKAIADTSLIQPYTHTKGKIHNQFSKTLYLPQQLPNDIQQLSIESFIFEQASTSEIDFNLLYQLSLQMQFDTERFTSSQTLNSLSGGEKIKLQLLAILAQSPDLILLDEPSNDLDNETIHWLAHWIRQTHETILFVSHDEWLLEQASNRVLLLDSQHHKTVLRHTIANVNYSTFKEEKEAQFLKRTQIAKKQQTEHRKKEQQLQSTLQHAHHNLNTVSRQSPYVAARLKKTMHTLKARNKRFEQESKELLPLPIKEEAILVKLHCHDPLPDRKVVLHLEDTTLAIDDKILAFHLTTWIFGQEKVAITGKNGVGKTTLLRTIYQKLSTRSDIKVAYMPQNYQEQLPEYATPLQYLIQTGDSDERSRIITYLASLRFTEEEVYQPIRSLSGGQKAKLFLLKLDLERPNVLLLDEPTRNFSPVSQPEIRKIFQDFIGCIIAVSHDQHFIRTVCHRVLELTSDGFVA